MLVVMKLEQQQKHTVIIPILHVHKLIRLRPYVRLDLS